MDYLLTPRPHVHLEKSAKCFFVAYLAILVSTLVLKIVCNLMF